MNKKPNLIYIFADQLAYNRVGYNDEYAYTPEIDKMEKESMNMDNAISNHPVCAPYRASLLTGKYTTSTGMVINEIRINPRAHKSFAQVLNENGYKTSYLGKWHLYAAQLGHHEDTKNSYIPVGEDRLGFDEFVGYNFHHQYYAPHAYYHLDSKEKIYVDGYEPDVQTNMAIETLKRLNEEGKPFAFFMSIGTPHDPWNKNNVPEEYYKKFENTKFPVSPNYIPRNDFYADFWARFMAGERAQLNEWKKVYYAMVANLDYNIGRLNKAISEMGLDENSIIVFTSDHGEMFGAHGRRAKNIFYDEACRVPFLIKWKNHLEPSKNKTTFSSVDIMPTLLSMMEINIPEDVEGTDKSKYLLSNATEDENEGSLLMCTGPTAMFGDGVEWRAYRTKQYTFAIYRRDGKEFLFDNLNDPYQMNNLIDDEKYKEIGNLLRQKMYKKMQDIGDDFEKNSYYQRYWVKNRIIKEHLARRREVKK